MVKKMLSGRIRLCLLFMVWAIIGVAMIGLGSQCPWAKMGGDDEISFDTGSSGTEAIAPTSNRVIVVIDSDGNVGEFPAIAVDSNNKVHISYYDGTYRDLKYITNDTGRWGSPIRIDGQNATDKGKYTSIVIDSTDKAHISYYDATNGDLKYATNATGAWVKDALDYDNNVGQYTDIALDADNNVYITYYDVTNGDLKCVTGTTGTWNTYTLDNAGNVGQYTSSAVISGSGLTLVHICYYDVDNGSLKYVTSWPDGTWAAPITVDANTNVGQYASIATVAANQAYISYYDAANGNLKYATITDGSTVVSSTIDSTGNVGQYTSIGVVSVTGQAQVSISYYDATNKDLKYASNAGGSWEVTTIDSVGDVGLDTSLATDDNNETHIIYYDNTLWDLKYTTMLIQPNDPSDLSASDVGPTSLVLHWTDNSNNEDGFKIERKAEGGSWLLIGLVGVNVTTYSDGGLWTQTTYYYRIRSYNSSIYSFYSSPIAVVTAGPPNTPSDLTVVALVIEPSRLTITWTDNSDNEDGFKIERKVSGGIYSSVKTVGPNITAYLDENLSPAVTYFYRVRAYSGSVNSAYSNEASGTTAPPPSTPSELTVVTSSIEPSRMSITWTDNANDEDGFKIERREGVTWQQINMVSPNITSYSDSGLSASTTYYYRARAYSGSAHSDYSNEASGMTSPLPNAPSGLTASAVSYSQINLQWDDNSDDEDGFKIERKAEGGSWGDHPITTVGTNVVYYENKGLSPNTTYYYRVKAYNGTVDSMPSNEASDTTDAP